MWSLKGFAVLVGSENTIPIIGRHYASFVYAFKLRSPAAVSPVLPCRTYKGSNRNKRIRARNLKIRMEKELEDVYGIKSKQEFNIKEWLIKNYFSEFKAFQTRLSIKFNDHKILMSAFAHPSFIEDLELIPREDVSSEDKDMLRRFEIRDEVSDIPFQKLSVLGYDTTLLTIKDEIYKKYPNITSSICSDVIKFLTSRDTICSIAKNLAVHDLLLLSRELDNLEDLDKEYHKKFTKDDLLCDTFYSLVGAIVKDLGLDAAKDFVNDFVTVLMHYEDLAEHVTLEPAYEELNNILLLNGVEAKTYARTIAESGVVTDFPFFVAGIYCCGCKIGEGSGYSAKTARSDAYKNAVFSSLEGDVDFAYIRKNVRSS